MHSLFKNEVPAFATSEMERLYQNPFSSALAAGAGRADTCTYVARTGSAASAVLLFQVRNRSIFVLNAAIPIAADNIDPFARLVFERYPRVRTVRFVSVAAANLRSAFPQLRFRASEDYVVELPGTVEAYQAALSKSMSSRLRQNRHKMRRDHPDFVFRIQEGSEITGRILDDILGLKNRSDHKAHRLDETEKTWLKKITAARGFLGISVVNGQIRAGTICTRIGNHFFTHVIAHDAAFDAYSLGTLNTYLTVCAGIARGGKEFHFLWGAGTWKNRLGARPQALHDVVIFRSRLHALLCPGIVIASCLRASWRRVKLGLIAAANPGQPFGWLVRPCLAQWYRLKHISHRLRAAAAERRQA